MTSRRAETLILDAIGAAERLARFVAGRTIDDYFGDEFLRSAVERQCEIFGEALSVLRKTAPEVAAEIRDIAPSIAFRNILVHGYFAIDDGVAWDIARNKIPPLVPQLRALRERIGGG